MMSVFEQTFSCFDKNFSKHLEKRRFTFPEVPLEEEKCLWWKSKVSERHYDFEEQKNLGLLAKPYWQVVKTAFYKKRWTIWGKDFWSSLSFLDFTGKIFAFLTIKFRNCSQNRNLRVQKISLLDFSFWKRYNVYHFLILIKKMVTCVKLLTG